MFVSGTNEIVEVKSDRRVGGRFSILERNHGEMIDHYGFYREINRPHRLVFTLEVPKHFPGATCITVEITRQNGGSQMAFTQTGVDPKITQDIWRSMFDTLASLIEENV